MPFEVIFGCVLLTRFLLPLAILRYPLPGVVACLVVDGMDQTVFQWFGYDPPFYQGYDKAMDVFYLGVAYISTMRNWLNLKAFEVSRFLFFYRQIGVVAFELSQVRALLMVFPNTFEYFFIAYEGIRSRWNTVRFQLKFWIAVAAFIWMVIKLPQEYWIHIAQLDFTDTVRDVPWFLPAIVVASLVGAAVFWWAIRPRLDPADHAWVITAPPLPEEMDTGKERYAFMADHGRVWSAATGEKVLLIGLLFVIFASILPETQISSLALFLWVAGLIVLNAAMVLFVVRRNWSTESVLVSFGARLVVNLGIVGVLDLLLGVDSNFRDVLFFLFLFSVLITLYDRYRPIHEFRFRVATTEGPAPVAVSEA
ncbi:MAG TPA: hypothetical protein VFX15_01485 [Actinomycetes bacterium]|nr:hypothetical protein [Actinomycetes bacterium]